MPSISSLRAKRGDPCHPLRHCERSAAVHAAGSHGLPRRCAPRNDNPSPPEGMHPRHREAEGRGDPCRNTFGHGLPRRFAPRSDETEVHSPFAVSAARNRPHLISWGQSKFAAQILVCPAKASNGWGQSKFAAQILVCPAKASNGWGQSKFAAQILVCPASRSALHQSLGFGDGHEDAYG